MLKREEIKMLKAVDGIQVEIFKGAEWHILISDTEEESNSLIQVWEATEEEIEVLTDNELNNLIKIKTKLLVTELKKKLKTGYISVIEYIF
ncbi:MAG: hypothetical protein ACRCW9_04020 [Cetobacterium sp.]